MNRAIDFIVQNLEAPLNLEAVARVSWFSPHHFHRIFRASVGETVNDFIKRLRLERALALMAHGPTRTLNEIAIASGFNSQSDFSRCFRQRFGVPPSAFDMNTFRAQRRDELDALIANAGEGYRIDRIPAETNPDDFDVELRRLPPRCVAYTRVLDPYRPDVAVQAVQRMVDWAEARGLADGQWLGYQWENPDIVALKDCRYDVGLEVDRIEPDGEIGRFDFPEMLVAQIEIRGPIDVEVRALDYFYTSWLPTSGYVPADLPCFEAWIGRPFAHGTEHFELHAQLPITRM